jgi:hypothetical protein
MVAPIVQGEEMEEELVWKSVTGEKRLHDMDDVHIVNLTHFLHHSPEHKNHAKQPLLLRALEKEWVRRNLTKAFLDLAPLPYQDRNGNWAVWDYTKKRPKYLSFKPVPKKPKGSRKKKDGFDLGAMLEAL